MRKQSINFSVELFPPNTDVGRQHLQETILSLQALGPRFFSVTFGAAGFSTQHLTTALVSDLLKTGIDATPHISCINLTPSEIDVLLECYHALGVKRLVVIRGDDPNN